ncbi:HD domain-containing phosphohydrolase [Nitrospina sp. 32_T5]|uniref:HD domain-containing phosphohydrolase n=1 Tax=unclassified Nitrospina TaxID=2638683 RepID=UPI003F97169B
MNTELAKKLLVIDDDATVSALVEAYLKEAVAQAQVQVQKAMSGEEGVQKALAWKPDLIFCDLRMPGPDGFEVIRRIRQFGLHAVAVLMSGCAEHEILELTQGAQKVGAEAFLPKPLKAHEVHFFVNYVLRMLTVSRQLQDKNQQLEKTVLEAKEYQKKIIGIGQGLQKENKRLQAELKEASRRNLQLEAKNEQIEALNEDLIRTFRATVNMLTNIIELHQSDHRGHPQRVEKMSDFIAQKLQLSPHQIQHIRTAARLHELGIVSQPANGNGHAKKENPSGPPRVHHTHLAEMLLRQFPGFDPTAQIIRHLYENVDGSGIPEGLSGEMIPIGSRIVSAASFYDHARVSHPGESPDTVMKLLEMEKGTRYDEDIVSLLGEFVHSSLFKDIDTIECTVFTLQEGMQLAADLYSRSGTSVLRKGALIDKSTLSNVIRFNNLDPIVSTIKVRIV